MITTQCEPTMTVYKPLPFCKKYPQTSFRSSNTTKSGHLPLLGGAPSPRQRKEQLYNNTTGFSDARNILSTARFTSPGPRCSEGTTGGGIVDCMLEGPAPPNGMVVALKLHEKNPRDICIGSWMSVMCWMVIINGNDRFECFGRVVGCCFQGQLIPIWLKWVLYIGCCTAGYSASPSLASLCDWIPANHNPPCFIWNKTKWIKTRQFYNSKRSTGNGAFQIQVQNKTIQSSGRPGSWFEFGLTRHSYWWIAPTIPSSHRKNPLGSRRAQERVGLARMAARYPKMRCKLEIGNLELNITEPWSYGHYMSLRFTTTPDHAEVSRKIKLDTCFAPRG